VLDVTVRQIQNSNGGYRHEEAGVIRAQLSPEFWIGAHEGLTAIVARQKLEGFLQLLVPVFQRVPGARLPDVRELLGKVEKILRSTKKTGRLPFLALHFLYNCFVTQENRTPGFDTAIAIYLRELSAPSTLHVPLRFQN
jgi:hypothetical protein